MLEHAEHDSSEIYDRPLGFGIFESELYLFYMHWSRWYIYSCKLQICIIVNEIYLKGVHVRIKDNPNLKLQGLGYNLDFVWIFWTLNL